MAKMLLQAVFGVSFKTKPCETISVGSGGGVAAEDSGKECYFHYLAECRRILSFFIFMYWVPKTLNEMMIMPFTISMSSNLLLHVLGAFFL